MLLGVKRGGVELLAWYALRVRARGEFAVAGAIVERGHAALVPTLTVFRHPNRYVHRKREVALPLLVRYVLAGFAGELPWHELAGLRERGLVEGVLMTGPERPARLDGRQVARFLAEHGDGNLSVPEAQRWMRTHREFAAGDAVEVMDGAFKGRSGRVDGLVGPIAKVLMAFFGAEIAVTIPLALLEKAD